MDLFVLNLLNGISFGAILFLLASGLTIMFGVMGILNLAHGALYMVGAYVGWTVAIKYGLNFGLAFLAAGLAGGLVGLAIERGFLRHLYKQLNEQVLLTFGFVYILTNLSLWIWGPIARVPFTAPFLSGSFPIGGVRYSFSRIAIIIVGGVLAIGLWWLQDKTRVGAILRAGMDNKEITMALGINLPRVSIFVFFLAAFIAGAAGVIGAPIFGAYLGIALNVLLLAVVVIIIGGVGSIQGALLASMLIGVIDAFGKALFPQFAMFTMYLLMVIILLIRPSGLLGRRV
jgi:branched-chain amino acid transport system permease protein